MEAGDCQMKRTQRNKQAAGEIALPEAVFSPVRLNKANGDVLYGAEASTEESQWRDSRGFAGVGRRGMFVEICTGTGEIS